MCRESGIYDKSLKDIIFNNKFEIHAIIHRDNEEEHDFDVLTLNDVYDVYLLLSSGICLALIVLLCEFIYKKFGHKYYNQISDTPNHSQNSHLIQSVHNNRMFPTLNYPTRHAIYGQLFVFKSYLYCIERRHRY